MIVLLMIIGLAWGLVWILACIDTDVYPFTRKKWFGEDIDDDEVE